VVLAEKTASIQQVIALPLLIRSRQQQKTTPITIWLKDKQYRRKSKPLYPTAKAGGFYGLFI
jgi:hypothetical protein